jgi:hypothetical protein
MARLLQNHRLIKFSLSLGVIAVTFTVTIPIPIEVAPLPLAWVSSTGMGWLGGEGGLSVILLFWSSLDPLCVFIALINSC